MRRTLSSILFGGIAAASMAAAQTPQAIHGTVTDAACGAHHGMANMTAAQCTRICAKESGFALVSGEKVYTLKGDKTMIDKYAGQAVTVKGKVDGKVIDVSEIRDK